MSAKMTKFQEYRKDKQEILYHPVKVTDEGIRLMVTVIDQMEATMRRFINYELPDCMAREEMKSLLDGPPVPGPEDELTQLRTRIAELEAVYKLAVDECNKATDERDKALHYLHECRRERDDRSERIAELEALTTWHEVGLIHDGTDLVITYNGKEVDVGWYHSDMKSWHLINGQPVRSKITHWMPLPEPPEVE